MNKQQSAKIIGDKFREIRTAKHLTQNDVAQRAGVSTNYYARIERADVSPTLAILEALTESLNVKSSDILPF